MYGKKTMVATLMVVAMATLAAACGVAAADNPDEPPTTVDRVDDRHAAGFVGLSVEDAAARAGEQGRPWRVIREDGVDLAVTADYSEDRLNFTVENGVVVAAVTDAEMISDGAPGIEPGDQGRESAGFVGLSVEDAAARAGEQGRPWRVIREDGVDLAVTADYSEDRLNFTVENGVVVAAVTDAEMVVDDSTRSSCQGAVAVIDEGEVIGVFDVNGDDRAEVFALIDDQNDFAQFGLWTWDEDCTLHPVTLDGSPAVLAAGLTESRAAGVSVQSHSADELYTIELTSGDGGTTFEGRITGYHLEGSQLIETSGEGAAFSGTDAAGIAVLALGDVTYP